MTASRNTERCLQRQVSARPSNLHGVVPGLQQPLLSHDIPDTQVPPREREANGRSLPSRDCRLLKTTQLPHWYVLARDAEVQLRHLLAIDTARVSDVRGDSDKLVPEISLASWRDCTGGIGCRRAVCLADLQVAVVEGGVAEPEAKFIARGDVLEVKVAVVDVDSLGEVGLGEVLEHAIKGNVGLQEVIVVGLVLGYRVRDASGGILLAVEKVDQSPAAILAWQVGEDDGSDVGVVHELVDETYAGVVEHDDSVGALISDVVDQAVGVVITNRRSVVSFRGPNIAKDKTGVARGVNQRASVLKVPVEIRRVFVSLGNKCVVWRAGEALRDGTGSSTADHSAIGRYRRVLEA